MHDIESDMFLPIIGASIIGKISLSGALVLSRGQCRLSPKNSAMLRSMVAQITVAPLGYSYLFGTCWFVSLLAGYIKACVWKSMLCPSGGLCSDCCAPITVPLIGY